MQHPTRAITSLFSRHASILVESVVGWRGWWSAGGSLNKYGSAGNKKREITDDYRWFCKQSKGQAGTDKGLICSLALSYFVQSVILLTFYVHGSAQR